MTILIYVVLIYIASNIVFVITLGTLGWWRNLIREKQAQTAPLYKGGDLSW